jgi:hypothetical protein
MDATIHPWMLPAFLERYQPSLYATTHPWTLPDVLRRYQPSFGATSRSWTLPAVKHKVSDFAFAQKQNGDEFLNILKARTFSLDQFTFLFFMLIQ